MSSSSPEKTNSKLRELGGHPTGQYRAEPECGTMYDMREGVETMHEAPAEGEDIVRAARIDKGAESGGNDRTAKLIWAAGFFDGEGSIGIYPAGSSGRSFQLSIVVGQVDTRPLQVFQELFEGNLFENAWAKRAKKGRVGWSWRASSRRAAAILTEMLPYLVNKRDEATLAIEFQAGKGVQPRNLDGKVGGFPLSAEDFDKQRFYAEEVKRLKRRVWN